MTEEPSESSSNVPIPGSGSASAPQSYIDIQYLATFGLFKQNALEYFYTSPFFDQTSNNQRVRMQGLHPDQHLSILQTMTGLEYVLDELNTCEPNLFVFRKQTRWSPKRSDLIDIYYCTDGIIYQSPDFLTLIKSRMAKSSYYLESSFEKCRAGARWIDGELCGKKRSSGYLCWQNDIPTPSSTTTPASDPSDDPFYCHTLAKRRAENRYERLLRDFPTFRTVLQDVGQK